MPMRTGDTPYEFAEAFAEWSKKQAREERWGVVLADVISEVHHLVDLYVKVAYTAHPVGSLDRWRAFESWGRLRWRLYFARILQGRRSLSEKSRRAPG